MDAKDTKQSIDNKNTESSLPASDTLSDLIVAVQVGPGGREPTKGSTSAAGYDLYAAETKIIPAGERQKISTQVYMAIPFTHYGRVAPRSGLAMKGIDVFGGVIDSDYRGDIGVILYNSDKKTDLEVRAGDRIAQIIFERCDPIRFVSVPMTKKLPETTRGSGGFGSTGN